MNDFDIKNSNRRKIYFYLRDNGLATKQDVAYKLQLSLPTVSQYLENLVEQGLVSCANKAAKSKLGGRYPVAYSYIADAKVAVGLDISRHHVETIIIDLDGNVIKYVYKKINYQRDDEYLKMLGDEVAKIIERAGVNPDRILGVGIAVPGLLDRSNGYVVDGRVIDNTGMTCKEFSKYIPYRTQLIHDSDASGFSEFWKCTDIHNALYVSLCNSIGCSVFIDDKVYLGDGLYSGEIGHLNLIPDGRKCYCGQRGCLDPYCNAEVLSNHTNGDLFEFFEKVENGDLKLCKVWDTYMDHLSTAITDMRMMYGCTIIIGGYIGYYMKSHMETLCKKVDEKTPFGERSESYLIQSKQKMEAVATGAALRFVKEFLEEV